MPSKPTGRPRGRPKGSKNVPKLEAFVADSLSVPIPAPPIPEKRKAHSGNVWAKMTPEERSAYARLIRAKRDPSTFKNAGRKKGVPSAYTAAQWEAHRAAQKPIIQRIMKKMSANGQLPDDPNAQEAMKEAMVVLRSQVPWQGKLAAARLVLDFTKSKPTTKAEVTVKSAEDYLDDMAEDKE
jgi:hypothetical protein